jgi:hypothetical protein
VTKIKCSGVMVTNVNDSIAVNSSETQATVGLYGTTSWKTVVAASS